MVNFKDYLKKNKDKVFENAEIDTEFNEDLGYDPFEKLEKEIIKENIQTVTEDSGIIITADSMEEAFVKASNSLDTDISNLDYQIVESGSKGLFGFGKKQYKIQI